MTIRLLKYIHELIKKDVDNKQKAVDCLNNDYKLVEEFINTTEDPEKRAQLEQELHNIETARSRALHNVWQAQDYLKDFEAEEF